MHSGITKIFHNQTAGDSLRGVIPQGATISGLLLGKDFFKNPKQINLAPIASYREVAEHYKIFPEAKDYLQKQLRNSKKHLTLLARHQQEYYYIIERKAQNKDWWRMIADGLFITPWQKRHEAIVRRNTMLLNDKPKPNNYLDVEKAKSFPLTDLIQFKNRVALCPFHNDKHPSFYYYPKTNTAYCFSCNTAADSIKIYQTLNGCSFKEAVQKLS